MNVKEIKELAGRYTPEQIENCISRQLKEGHNICLRDESTERIINELSKAGFVRKLMDEGMSLPEALRELARRIRQVQSLGGD